MKFNKSKDAWLGCVRRPITCENDVSDSSCSEFQNSEQSRSANFSSESETSERRYLEIYEKSADTETERYSTSEISSESSSESTDSENESNSSNSWEPAAKRVKKV